MDTITHPHKISLGLDETILNDQSYKSKFDKILQAHPQPFTDRIETEVAGVPIICFRSVHGDNFLFNRQPIITVGRKTPSRNIKPSFDLNPHKGVDLGVSRKHAKIIFQNEKFHIIDLDSTNGTRINDKLLVPHQMTPIYENDKITFGLFVVHVVWIS